LEIDEKINTFVDFFFSLLLLNLSLSTLQRQAGAPKILATPLLVSALLPSPDIVILFGKKEGIFRKKKLN